MKRWLLFPMAMLLLAACSSDPAGPGPDDPVSATIDSFGASPNPSPANVGTQFSWTVFGQNLTCQLDVEGDGTVDYTVPGCTSQSRVIHTYGVQGSFDARLTVSGADGKTVEVVTPVSVSSPNTPPTIPSLTPAPPPSITDPLAVQFTWVVADFDADVTRCRFDAESDGVWDFDNLCSGLPATSGVGKASSVTFSYTHRYSKKGRYEATLEAADPYISTRNKVAVRVPWNRAPEIHKFTATAGDNNMAVVDFSVSDVDGDELECILGVESLGSFRIPDCNKGTRRYTFKEQGNYLITLAVKDTLGARVTNSRTVDFGGGSNEKIIAEPALVLTSNTTCYLSEVGKMYCWGWNYYGQLGNGTSTGNDPHPSPELMPTDLRFKSAAGGQDHFCALTEVGEAYCWGYNGYGQLGDGTTTEALAPLKVPTDLRFKQIAAGLRNSCGLTEEGDIYCWGIGADGILGQADDTYGNSSSPVMVQAGGVQFVQMGLGYQHICALTALGEAYCWGFQYYGEIGIDPAGTPNPSDGNSFDPGKFDSPQRVALDHKFKSLTVGTLTTCGLVAAGSTTGDEGDIYCWGDNREKSLGTGPSDSANGHTPRKVVGGHTFAQHLSAGGAAGGGYAMCALEADGDAWCWGYNKKYGALGVGNTTNQHTPQQIPTYKFEKVWTGTHSCGITLDKRLMCWGYNEYGQLGNGDATRDPNPDPVYVNPLP